MIFFSLRLSPWYLLTYIPTVMMMMNLYLIHPDRDRAPHVEHAFFLYVFVCEPVGGQLSSLSVRFATKLLLTLFYLFRFYDIYIQTEYLTMRSTILVV